MNKHRGLNVNIIKHHYKHMYPNADQIQLQKLHVTVLMTLMLSQLSKGCFIYDVGFNKEYTNDCIRKSGDIDHLAVSEVIRLSGQFVNVLPMIT